MSHIHWYPGHIAKAQRELKQKLSLVDVVLEVVDARIPYSSWYQTTDELCPNKPRLILMNKSDVSDPQLNKLWADCIKKVSKCDVLVTSANSSSDTKKIISKIIELSSDIMEKRKQKGLLARPVRTMVIGLPNVGKSSTINRLVGRAKTKTGAKAGVTRMQQWVRINDKIELLDTPGIISTVQDDQNRALKLAFVNSVGENAYDSEFVAQKLINILNDLYPDNLRKYFDFDETQEISLDLISLKRNWVLKGNTPDTKRCSKIVLSNFQSGKIGKFTLEIPQDYGFI